MSIQIHSLASVDQAIAAASTALLTELTNYLAQGNQVLLLLSGGSATKVLAATQIKIAALHLPPEAWKNKVFITLGDERWANLSNTSEILKTDFIRTCVLAGAEYYPLAKRGKKEAAAQALENWLIHQWQQPHIKTLAVIGIGADAHTLSINVDPYQQRFASLFQGQSLVTAYHSQSGTAQFPTFPDRITLTLTGLAKVDIAIGLIAGAEKKEMLKNLIHTEDNVHLQPAQALKMISTQLYTDQII